MHIPEICTRKSPNQLTCIFNGSNIESRRVSCMYFGIQSQLTQNNITWIIVPYPTINRCDYVTITGIYLNQKAPRLFFCEGVLVLVSEIQSSWTHNLEYQYYFPRKYHWMQTTISILYPVLPILPLVTTCNNHNPIKDIVNINSMTALHCSSDMS